MKPHLHIRLFNRNISAFHFFGVTGYVAGSVLGAVLCMLCGLSVPLILMMSATGAATFFGLAYAVKKITGKENIVYYHHEIAIIITCTVVLYLLKQPVLPYLDITLLGIGTFLAFGRVGCYSVGCCHGRPHRHGVIYGQAHADAGFTWFYKDVPLLPVQLVESAFVFLVVVAGSILVCNHVLPGTVLIMYTVIYGLFRFTIEYWRGDAGRPLRSGISEAQWTTLALTAITYAMSLAGWLPQYAWHAIALAAMTATAAITIFYYHRKPEHMLFDPPHVRQVAEGLNILEAVNANPKISKDKVNMYTTHEGLCISCGSIPGHEHIRHYTVSAKNNMHISPHAAERMAQLIGVLSHNNGRYELISKQNGIYHILFDMPRQEVMPNHT